MSQTDLLKLKSYLPAITKTTPSMGWFVEYYVFDPVEERMIRKRIRIQKLIKRYRTKREQAIAAQQIAEELNHRLASGWSPLYESDDSRLYTPIDTLRDRFLEAKRREGYQGHALGGQGGCGSRALCLLVWPVREGVSRDGFRLPEVSGQDGHGWH